MQEIASMVDMRFGHGTWRSIVDERAKRIREAKEAQQKARRLKRQQEMETAENIKQFFMISFAILAAAVFFIGMIFIISRTLNNPIPKIFSKNLAGYIDFVP